MEISGAGADAATYALKKALEMPETILKLLPQPASDPLSSSSDITVQTTNAVQTITGKGSIIDIVA